MILRVENGTTGRKISPRATLSTADFTWTGQGSNPRSAVRVKKVTACFTHGYRPYVTVNKHTDTKDQAVVDVQGENGCLL
jgi:hypothetical protein